MAKRVKIKVREQRKPRNMAVVHMFNRGHAVHKNKKAESNKKACRGNS